MIHFSLSQVNRRVMGQSISSAYIILWYCASVAVAVR
jgi:hypothetical protein